MVHRISTIIVCALLATSIGAEDPKCSATARECDHQIRQMLSGRRFLGVTVQELNPGLVVKAVVPNSPAERAGLRSGDRLVAVNGKSLAQASSREFKQIIAEARETGRLMMIITRGGVSSKVVTRLEPYTREQIQRIVSAHLSQSHTSTTANAQ
jgi:C-terminal processing protease CtpA/Prc